MRAPRWRCRSSAGTSSFRTRPSRADLSDPVVGMVGELPDPEWAAGMALHDGDAIGAGGALRPLAGRLRAGEAARRSRQRASRASRSRRCARRSSCSQCRPRRNRELRPRRQRRRPRVRPGGMRHLWRGGRARRPRSARRAARRLGRGLPVRGGPRGVRGRGRGREAPSAASPRVTSWASRWFRSARRAAIGSRSPPRRPTSRCRLPPPSRPGARWAPA